MKKYSVLFANHNENLGGDFTPSAIKVRGGWKFRNGEVHKVDLKEQRTVCIHWDNDGLTYENRYDVSEIQLPAWLEPFSYFYDCVSWKYLWGFGADPEWPEQWQRRLLKFGEAQKLVAITLLKTKKFRSPFRQSMHDHLVEWLDAKDPKYESPFSMRMWMALLGDRERIEAKRRSNGLYYIRNRFAYAGAPQAA